MPEDATALLALWNDVDPALEPLYNDWHAHEHVPQRLTVPGILWGWRYRRTDAGTMPRYLTLYGLRDAAVFDSAAYQQLLREPTPLSQQMRPALRNLSRWVCSLDLFRHMNPNADLAVRTWPADSVESRPPSSKGPGTLSDAACLLARRLPQARPLPWLSADQRPATPSVTGDWLQATSLAFGQPAKASRGDGAVDYTSLAIR